MSDQRSLNRRTLLRSSAVASGALVIGTQMMNGSATALEQSVQQAASVLQAMPATVQNTQSSLYSATNNTYGTQSSSGSYTHCAVVFTAPETGRVIIQWSGGVRNIASGSSPVAYLSPEVRAGGTVGSGTVVLGSNDARSVRTNLAGSATVRAGAAHLLAGLVPGNSYNARILHRVTSQTGEFFQRGLIVAPAT
jgi:hypothetical protein